MCRMNQKCGVNTTTSVNVPLGEISGKTDLVIECKVKDIAVNASSPSPYEHRKTIQTDKMSYDQQSRRHQQEQEQRPMQDEQCQLRQCFNQKETDRATETQPVCTSSAAVIPMPTTASQARQHQRPQMGEFIVQQHHEMAAPTLRVSEEHLQQKSNQHSQANETKVHSVSERADETLPPSKNHQSPPHRCTKSTSKLVKFQSKKLCNNSRSGSLRRRFPSSSKSPNYIAKHKLKRVFEMLENELESSTLSDDNYNNNNHSQNDKIRDKLLAKPSGKSSCCRTLLKVLAIILLIILIFILVVIPVTFRCSLSFRRFFLFMNEFRLPIGQPDSYGLNCTRAFRVAHLGVWHVKSNFSTSDGCFIGDEQSSSVQEQVNSSISSRWLSDKAPVVVYAHGIGGTRSTKHRMHLYRTLSTDLGAHVIAFDYTAYGDSNKADIPHPSAPQMFRDTLSIIGYLERQGVTHDRIYAYGHSLGTSVMVNTAAIMQNAAKKRIKAVILEAPILSIGQVLYDHPLSKVFAWLPYFKYCFVDPIVQNNDTNFDSVGNVHNVHVPLFIMHAEDDYEVPFHHGKELYETAKRVQPLPARNFTGCHWFKVGGHLRISRNVDFIKSIRSFMNTLPNELS